MIDNHIITIDVDYVGLLAAKRETNKFCARIPNVDVHGEIMSGGIATLCIVKL